MYDQRQDQGAKPLFNDVALYNMHKRSQNNKDSTMARSKIHQKMQKFQEKAWAM